MKFRIVVLLLLLFVFRLFLSTQSKHGDMYNNLDWGRIAVEHGLVNFYELPKIVWPHLVPTNPPAVFFCTPLRIS